MVLDTSAVIAYLRREPEAQEIGRVLYQASSIAMSAVNELECRIVLHNRFGIEAATSFDQFARTLSLDVVAFDTDQAFLAYDAHRRYGKGSGHPARLNLSDCAAYALAVSLARPLIFKGSDFRHTDVTPAF
jgi:ribonuclease VapC